MSTFVLDSSVTMTWCFPDERNDYAESVLARLRRAGAIVPPLWHLEVRNGLLVGEGRGRIDVAQSQRFLSALGVLPIRTDAEPTPAVLDRTLDAARRYGLSVYDAAYVELALRTDLPVASLDSKLREAATNAGATIYMPAP